jgi:glutamine amidotransferase
VIAIVDYGVGNLRSLSNALEFLGQEVIVTRESGELEQASRIVLPGVGAFGDAMQALRDCGVLAPLEEQVRHKRKPTLGICLGMQLMARTSDEHGTHEGLGWIDAHVKKLDVAPLKVPHVGWNELHFNPADPLLKGLRNQEANVYFVHSHHMVCTRPEDCIATTLYGMPVTAVVRHANVTAMQFHPEKSQDNGLRLLQNWIDFTEAAC